MKFSASIASSILLFAPFLVGAAPVANPDTAAVADVASIADYSTIETSSTTPNARSVLVAREDPPVKCDARKPHASQKKALEHYNREIRRMKDFTAAAHAAENRCRGTDYPAYRDSRNPVIRDQIRTRCMKAYKECVDNRKAATQVCVDLGGTRDPGHEYAIEVCNYEWTLWKKENPDKIKR